MDNISEQDAYDYRTELDWQLRDNWKWPGNEAKSLPQLCAIFEFGRGFYGNTYTPVLSDLTLTPGRLQIFCNCKRRKAGRGPGTRLTYTYNNCKKSCVARMA